MQITNTWFEAIISAHGFGGFWSHQPSARSFSPITSQAAFVAIATTTYAIPVYVYGGVPHGGAREAKADFDRMVAV